MSQKIAPISQGDVVKAQQQMQEMVNSMADVAQSDKISEDTRNSLLQQMQQVLQQFQNMLNPSAGGDTGTGPVGQVASQPARNIADNLPPPPKESATSDDTPPLQNKNVVTSDSQTTNPDGSTENTRTTTDTGTGASTDTPTGTTPANTAATGAGTPFVPQVPPGTPISDSSAVKVNSDGTFSTKPQQGALSEADAKTQAVNVAKRLEKDFGFNDKQAAGIVGNLYHESAGMNANVNEFGSGPPDQAFGAPNAAPNGYGWAQWTDRKPAFLAYAKSIGLDPASPEANYQMLKHELETTESATVPLVKATQTAEEAATVFRAKFERATSPVDESRKADANAIEQLLA